MSSLETNPWIAAIKVASTQVDVGPVRTSEIDVKAPWSQVVMIVDQALEDDLRAGLDASPRSVFVNIPIYAMTIEKTFSHQASETVTAQRTDHLMADAVLFISETVTDAAHWYLWWLRQCSHRLAAGSIAPEAHIYCTAERAGSEEFNEAFLSRPGANDLLQNTLGQAAFRSLHVCAGLDPFSFGDIETLVCKSAKVRKAFNMAWSCGQALRIKVAYMGHLAMGKSTAFRVRPAVQWPRFLEGTRRPYVEALLLSNTHRTSQPAFRQVLTSYIGNDEGILLVPAHPVAGANDIKVHQTRLATECAQQSLRERLKTLLAPFQELRGVGQRSLAAAITRRLLSWKREADRSPEMTLRTIRDRHIDTLGKHSSFLETQQYGPLCFFCFSRPWARLSRCNSHGVCDLCWPPYRDKLGHRCIICDTDVVTHAERMDRGVERGRILALDGGGVRGLIQLEVLAMLEEEIGLDLPLRRFFDLIVGTSIGKL